MASAWKKYLNRSIEHLRDRSAQVIRAQPTALHTNVLPMLSINTPDDLTQFVTGCDSDLGGKSVVNFDMGEGGGGRFWGRLDSELKAGRRREGVVERGGYAGLRSKSRTSFFGARTWDTTSHPFLKIRARSSGDQMRYFINIQTDGPVQSDLFQHRLWLPNPSSPEAPHEFTDILIPFSDFTLTNSGDLSEIQIEMLRSRIRTVGVSVLGPKIGRFELGLESICAIALPESTSLPSKTPAQLAEEKQDREQVLKRREEGRGEVVEEMEDRDEMLSKGTQRRNE